MKQKILSLLTLLVVCVTGAWADETFTFAWTSAGTSGYSYSQAGPTSDTLITNNAIYFLSNEGPKVDNSKLNPYRVGFVFKPTSDVTLKIKGSAGSSARTIQNIKIDVDIDSRFYTLCKDAVGSTKTVMQYALDNASNEDKEFWKNVGILKYSSSTYSAGDARSASGQTAQSSLYNSRVDANSISITMSSENEETLTTGSPAKEYTFEAEKYYRIYTECSSSTGAQLISFTFVPAVTTYTISFAGNGNTGGTMTNHTGITSGSDVSQLNANAFEKTGHTFANWKTNTALTYVAYGNEDTEGNRVNVAVNGTVPDKAKIKNVTGDITLTAQWTANTYDVTLNTNGGTINAGDVTSYTYGVGATLPTDVTKDDYDFAGWYDNSSFTGSAIEEIADDATGDKEYWAKWTAALTKYDITFAKGTYSAYDGAVSFPSAANASNTTLPTLSSDNSYRFDGWKADVDVKNGAIDGETISAGTLIVGSTRVYVTSNATFTAQWTQKYAVTFNSKGGSAVATQYIASGSTAEEPAAPTRLNYTFANWQLSGSDYDFSATVTNDIILDATRSRNTISAVANEEYVADTEHDNEVTSATSYSGTSFSLKKIDSGSYSIAQDKSSATSSDSKTFSYGFYPNNTSSETQGFQLTANKDISSLKVYYTMSDSKFTTDDQSKSGNFTYKINSGEAQVSSNTSNKSNKTAYIETISSISKDDVVKLYSSANRLVIFGLYTTYAGTPLTVTVKVTGEEDQVINVTSGETLGNIFAEGTLPTPVVSSPYTFNGWKNEANDAAVTDETVISGSMVIYADITAPEYTITLDKGTNGATDGAAIVHEGDTQLTVTTAVEGEEHYILEGYYTSSEYTVQVADAEGNFVEAATTYTNASGEWTYTSNTTLYAKWRAASQYTISITAGATGAIGSLPTAATAAISGYEGETVTLPVNSYFYLADNHATCWTNGTTDYSFGQEITLSENLNLYPKFVATTNAIGDADATVTWNLGIVSADMLHIEGSGATTGYLVTSAEVDEETIDVKSVWTPNGENSLKLYNANRSDEWAQVNYATITIPAVKGMQVTVNAYANYDGDIKLNGVAMTTTSDSRPFVYTGQYTGTAETVDITVDNSGKYLSLISVDYKAGYATPTIVKSDVFNFEHKGYPVTITASEGTLKVSTNDDTYESQTSPYVTYATPSAHHFYAKAEGDIYNTSAVADLDVENNYDTEKSYVAWVFESNYSGYSYAEDPMADAIDDSYNVVRVNAYTTDMSNADLIIVTEALDGKGTFMKSMKNFVGETPMINLKFFAYTKGTGNSDRWNWGAPTNNTSYYTITPSSALYKVLNGVTFELDGSIKMYDNSPSGNVIQTIAWDAEPTDFPASNVDMGTTNSKVSMHSSNKFFGLGLSCDNKANYSANAITIVKNAAAMLIAGESLTAEVSSVSASIGSTGWATFSSSYPLDFTGKSVNAYKVTGVDESNVVELTQVYKVPANTGLLLSGTTDDIPVATGVMDDMTGNLMVAGDGSAVTASATKYVLANQGEPAVLGFYKIASDVAVPYGKAYLDLTGVGSPAPAVIRIVDEENNATNLQNLDGTNNAVKFIENGRLYILKNGITYDALGRVIR